MQNIQEFNDDINVMLLLMFTACQIIQVIYTSSGRYFFLLLIVGNICQGTFF